MMISTLSLPQLHANIPMTFRVPGEAALATPLAIALIEADMVTDAMLAAPGVSERKVAELSLTKWWTDLQARYPLKHFHWSLHIQELEDLTAQRPASDAKPLAWFCMTNDTKFEPPRFTLARRITELEGMLPGFGQTVLAVLRQTCMRLPDALDPWRAADWAEYLWWSESRDDAELLEQYREMNGFKTIEEAMDDAPMTRASFYEHMPRWVTSPRQVATKEAIIAAAKTPFARSVIAACDALSELCCSKDFRLRPSDVGAYHCGYEAIGGCMVLLWTLPGVIGQAIDEFVDLAYECGEYVEFIDSHPLDLSTNELKQYMQRTEKVMQIAMLAERLLDLIGDQE
jgi:PRTRC genetic system protein F